MGNKLTERYLDNLLNTMNGVEEITEDDIRALENIGLTSKDDFLRQFESELESEEYDDYLSSFEKELEQDSSLLGKPIDIQTPAPSEQDATLDEMLMDFDRKMKEEKQRESEEEQENELLDEAMEQLEEQNSEREIDASEYETAYDEVADTEEESSEVYEEFATEDEVSPMSDESDSFEVNTIDEIGEPDLAGNATEDLLDLLEGKDLSDIGELLTGNTDSVDSEDSDSEKNQIDSYAQQQMDEHEKNMNNDKAQKKGNNKMGFFKKLTALLTKEAGEEEEDKIEMKAGADADAKALSLENQQILDELEAAEIEEQASKKKAKKEKKPKQPKAKKVKQPKAKKPPKPKKEKIKWEKEPKLPKGPVRLIWIFAASLVALVVICTFLVGNSTKYIEAQNTYNKAISAVSEGDETGISLYTEAYGKLSGLKLSGDNEKLYNRLSLLATVGEEYESYKAFSQSGYNEMAIDSLVCAAGRCDLNAENAEAFDCVQELENLKNIISQKLQENYGMSYEQAVEIYNMRDRDEYTITLKEKLAQLGLGQETE